MRRQILGVGAGAVLVVAVWFRIFSLGHVPGVNGDEVSLMSPMREISLDREVPLWAPTGRVLSPIYLGLAYSIQRFFPEISFSMVRMPALVSGLALILLSFLLFSRVFTRPIAWMVCVLVAATPMHIAYSRVSIEESLMPLALLICLYFMLTKNWRATVISYTLAIFTHPLMIFSFPMVFLPFAADEWKSKGTNKEKWVRIAKRASVLGGISGFVVLLMVQTQVAGDAYSFLLFCFKNPLLGIKGFIYFVGTFLRALSGISVYEQFAKEPGRMQAIVADLAMGLIFLNVLYFGVRKLKAKGLIRERAILVGFLLSVFSQFLVWGPNFLDSATLRHGSHLPVAFIVVLAVVVASHKPSSKAENLAAWAGVGAASLLLVQFWFSFFQSIQRGEVYEEPPHRSYFTGPMEPKAAAFQWIVQQASGDKLSERNPKIVILAEDWWIYWPLRYLALSFPVIQVDLLNQSYSKASFEEAVKAGAFAVGFTGGKVGNYFHEQYAKDNFMGVKYFSPATFSGHPVLTAWRIEKR